MLNVSLKRLLRNTFRAIQNKNEFAVESLISAGADVDISNINGGEKITFYLNTIINSWNNL